VLASIPIEGERDGTLLVDADALLLRDAFDLLSQLRRPTRAVGGVMVREQSSKAADWRLDKDRSVIDLEHTASFPLNTEVEALLTFATDSESDLNQPDPHSLSVREHHSFLAMPAPGYEALEQDPRVGFISVGFQDFSQPYDQPLTRYLVQRWRLQKKDSNAALSEPVKPIVFYLDRAIPEPVRSAARMGALWWNQAFEQAGFKRTAHRGPARRRGPDGHSLSHHPVDEPLGTGMVRGPKPRRSAHGRDHSRRGATGFAPHAHDEQLLGGSDALRPRLSRARAGHVCRAGQS
jgi:hypothetical protein